MNITRLASAPLPAPKPTQQPAPPPERGHHFHQDTWLHRGLETAHVGLELLHHAPEGRIHQAGAAAAGLVSVAAVVDGWSKIQHADCKMEKLEAAASFALAGEMGLHALGELHGHAEILEKVALPLAFFHHGVEVAIGIDDAKYAHSTGNKSRLIGGLAQIGVGVSLMAAHVIPGAALPLHIAGAAAMVVRQALLSTK